MSDDSTNLSQVPTPAHPIIRYGAAAITMTVVLYFASQVAGVIAELFVPIVHHMSKAQLDVWIKDPPVGAQFAAAAVAYGFLLAGIWGLLRLYNWTWATIGLTRPKIRHILLGLVVALPYFFVYILIVGILGALIPSLNVSQKQEIGFDSVHGLMPLIITFISLVVIPPIAEEITMRGFLYTSLKRWLPRVAAALLVSALFAVAHLPEGGDAGPLWVGAIDTFVLSLFLVSLRELTGNLWAGITLHAAKNCVAFVFLFIIGGR